MVCMFVVHGKCGKRFPGNNTHGHCGSCHETFVGQAAFDAHWVTSDSGERVCVSPSALKGEWWQDASGYWHKGRKLTEEERNKIWSGDLEEETTS